MNWLVKLLAGNDKDIGKKSVIWNVVASLIYSFQSAILLLVVTRVGGLFTAGVFSIAYSVSQMFASVGSYSMRDYQASDASGQYSFSTYKTSRYVTIAIMLVTCLVYSLFNGYRGEKLIVLMTLSLYRAVDGYDDVMQGELQKRGRLDIASKMLAIRIFMASLIFSIVFIITRNLIVSSVCLTVSAIAFSAILNYTVFRYYDIRSTLEFKKILSLLAACLPICAGAFLYNYLVNSPKYAIDAILSEDMQTIFNIIFMPVFAINMFGSFIFKPYIVQMGVLWESGKKKKLVGLLMKQMLMIAAVTVIVVIGGALLGIPVLQLIYGVELNAYRPLFILLLLFGGVSALDSFGSVILTVIRRQHVIIIAYIIALIIDVIFMNMIVRHYAIWGAGLVYGLAMTTILVVYVVCIFATFVGGNKKND